MYDLIEKLTGVFGPSGRENKVADAIEKLVKSHVDTVSRDSLGNLICLKKGEKGGRRIMLSAHMDQIGLAVTAAEKEGVLRVAAVGGVFLDMTRTRHMVFANGVQGVLVMEPIKEGEKAAIKNLYIDIGAKDAEEALSMVKLGDIAVYAPNCFPMGKHRVCSPAMDDRAACALLVSILGALPKKTKDTIIAVFSTQEEVGCRGAKAAAYGAEPEIGIALDVTLNGDTPETKLPAIKLGEGAAVKIMDRGSISNPELVEELLAAGKRAKVKTQREVLAFGGTDAMSMQVSRGGMRVGTVSIPCRNVHSACEVVDLRDMEAAKALVLEYLK